ncbi:hypothetical protein DBR36_15840 [Microbacterium sp. HMWF026]|nr:hypothetical protein DBR36_15840 [Microbacterium sp. HMWF026]
MSTVRPEAGRSSLRVLPLRPGTNIPAIAGWPARATDDTAQIEAWREQIPGCNWGILTGGGLGVLDIDTKSAPEWSFGGFDSLIQVEELLELDLGDLPLVQTASGAHLYFRYDGVLPSRVPWIEHVDLKADAASGQGHQVAAPGTFRTDIPGEPRTYELVRGDLASIPYAPEALVRALREWRGSSNGSSGGGGSSVELPETDVLRRTGFRLGQRDNGFNTLMWRLVRNHYPHLDLVRQIAYEIWRETDNPPGDVFPWSKVENQMQRAVKSIGPDVEAQLAWASSLRGAP